MMAVPNRFSTCTEQGAPAVRETAVIPLRSSEVLYRSILEASADSIAVLALDGRVELINARGRRAMHVTDPACAVGQDWIELWPRSVRPEMQAAMRQAMSGTAARLAAKRPGPRGDCTWWDVIVTPIPGENRHPSRLLATCRDITQSRKSAERLKWTSEHDGLTNLSNRTAFQSHLQAAVIRAMQSGSSLGLLLLDVDHFRYVNDTLGHGAGDQLLQSVAHRLNQSLRARDFAARLGGDQFALILEDVDDDESLRRAGASIAERLNGPVVMGERTIAAGISIGAALFPRDASSAHELFNAADSAKSAGSGGLSMFHGSMRDQAQRIASQLNLARVALDQGSVLPHYQPKIDLSTSQLIGYEALLRWMHPSRGLQMPDTVQQAFKDYELATKIGELMRRRVIGDVRALLEREVPFGRLALNAAPAEFLRDDYAERLLDALSAAGVPPHLIEIEVTEHVLSRQGAEYVARALNVLSRQGVTIALDDFGTGCSSLSHLRDFPVDVVKIDRSFVDSMNEDEEISAIVTAIIGLARSLSLQVIAEGIETDAQRQALLAKGCDGGQGFFFGRPMPFSVLASRKRPDWTH
jgi:diguanylate cyclase (GGDEF)-like protein/PAS domain S-box-containing protein